MQAELAVHDAIDLLEQATGIVIPVYFRPTVDAHYATALLAATVRMVARELADPAAICLSADGGGLSQEVAQQVAAAYKTRLVAREANRGKLASVRNGMAQLLGDDRLRYLAVMDCDGDHFANELLNFVRRAEDVAHKLDTRRLLVLGTRLSRHRPLGFLRGEQEELANRLLLDALHYAAARAGKPLALQFAGTEAAALDFHSGYKLFSRAAAEDVFCTEPQLAGCDEAAYYRHACEAVMVVEAVERGALLATVSRRTFDEQPLSSFAQFERAQLHANLIIWPCKRLAIPGHFVAQWLANHLPQLTLGTLAPQGQAELLAIRKLVLQAFDQPIPAGAQQEIMRPDFL